MNNSPVPMGYNRGARFLLKEIRFLTIKNEPITSNYRKKKKKLPDPFMLMRR